MARYSARLAQLETKLITPPPVHIIMKSYAGQTHDDAFEVYQAKRTAEGYTPQEGWEQLRTDFVSDNQRGQLKFITFDVMESAAPKPPIVTNAKQNYE